MKLKLLQLIWTGMLSAALLCFASCGEAEPEIPEEPANPTVKITDAGVSDYWVIRSDFSNEEITKASVKVRKTIKDVLGVELGITTDWEKNPVYEHEIIVGKTLREEGLAWEIDRLALGETGYVIKELDGKIYIAGGSDIGTSMAVDYFLENFIKAGQDVEIPQGYERVRYHEYEMTLYVNMTKITNDWKILIPNKDNRQISKAAEMLQSSIYDKCGVWMEIEVGKSQPNAFVISDEKPETGGVHTMNVENDRFVFRSSANTGVGACVNTFINLYIDGKFGKFNFPADYEYFDLGDYLIVKNPASLKG